MTTGKFCYEYPRPAVTADVVVLAGARRENLKILLIKRRYPPFKDMWALPGGFVDKDEDLEVAAHRELEEETGLKGVNLRQIGAFGKPFRDPRHHTITVAYLASLEHPAAVQGDDDAQDASWFPIDGLPPLAFDHETIIGDGLRMWENQ
ncbi:NUDIX domain-containing protein [Thermophagus sp. OGC60D27]|uniref:NUDIX domain-containing protein n=1 Tax=Thermophagus sp. OGC60D27 TaxID=3458415 RepID=UPI0040381CBF